MKNNKRNIKTKNNLNQFIIAVTIIILSILIGYITKENELSEDVSNYNTKTNIINDTNINDIPEYSGEIVITINNDIPYFEEKDISLAIDGMGIVFYSPETNREIPEGSNFFAA